MTTTSRRSRYDDRTAGRRSAGTQRRADRYDRDDNRFGDDGSEYEARSRGTRDRGGDIEETRSRRSAASRSRPRRTPARSRRGASAKSGRSTKRTGRGSNLGYKERSKGGRNAASANRRDKFGRFVAPKKASKAKKRSSKR